jgi:hypothetical protein
MTKEACAIWNGRQPEHRAPQMADCLSCSRARCSTVENIWLSTENLCYEKYLQVEGRLEADDTYSMRNGDRAGTGRGIRTRFSVRL